MDNAGVFGGEIAGFDDIGAGQGKLGAGWCRFGGGYCLLGIGLGVVTRWWWSVAQKTTTGGNEKYEEQKWECAWHKWYPSDEKIGESGKFCIQNTAVCTVAKTAVYDSAN